MRQLHPILIGPTTARQPRCLARSMMVNMRGAFLVSVALTAACSSAPASFVVFTDKASFLASSGAVDATGNLPEETGFIGPVGGSPPGTTTTVGTVGFQAVRYRFADVSGRLPGSELTISFGAEGAA